MDTRKDIALLRWEELLVLVAEQQRQIAQLHGQLAEATTTIKALQVEVDRLKRGKSALRRPFPKGLQCASPSPRAVSLVRGLSPSAKPQSLGGLLSLR